MSLSPIERLPVELIQGIFLLSGPNLNLPLASHHIAAKLSDEYIYDTVCTEYLTANEHSRVEQSINQSRIFAARWMTWEYFKSFLVKTYEGKGCLCGKTEQEGCFDAQWPPDWEHATDMVFGRSHLPELSWVKCRIPVKLLHGPWTSDKIEFLRFLLWITAMTVDWADQNVRETILLGKKEAIMERNLEMVEIFNENRRLGRPPDLSTIRFAVMDAGCDRSIVYNIMKTVHNQGLRDAYSGCAELDAWCKERIENGDPKGKWLQVKLGELGSTDGPLPWTTIEDKAPSYTATEQFYGEGDDQLVVHKLKWNQVSGRVSFYDKLSLAPL